MPVGKYNGLSTVFQVARHELRHQNCFSSLYWYQSLPYFWRSRDICCMCCLHRTHLQQEAATHCERNFRLLILPSVGIRSCFHHCRKYHLSRRERLKSSPDSKLLNPKNDLLLQRRISSWPRETIGSFILQSSAPNSMSQQTFKFKSNS